MGETKELRIGWSWDTEDGWLLHRKIKGDLWRMLDTGEIDLKTIIAALSVKEEWLEIRPTDKIPVNYKLLQFIGKQYIRQYRSLKPPIRYRLGMKKITIMFLTLFREDSAYCERFGGICQYIIDNHEDWVVGDKEARLLALTDLKEWWLEEDWRTRGKDRIAKLFDYVIERYETEEFVRRTVDYWVDSIIKNKGKWDRGINAKTGKSYFDPISWYPRGKGQTNYICHGRLS